MQRPMLCITLLSAAALAGCAAVPERGGFDDVQALVGERSPAELHWRTGGAEDEAVDAAIQNLLQRPLSEQAAVQIALLNNRRLQATYEELGIAQATLVQAGLLRNPIFEAEVAWPSGGGSPDLLFSLVQEFLDLLSLPLRKRVAAAEFEAVKLRTAGAVLDLVGQTRAGWYRAVAAGQMVEMRAQVARATAASYEFMQRLHEAGNVTSLDLAREQALAERARLDLAAAELALAAEREALGRLLGLWGADAAFELPMRLAEWDGELSLEQVEARAVEASLDLGVARAELEALAQRLGLPEQSGIIPELELGAVGEREDGEWERGPVIAFPLPVFDQGQARRAGARAALRRAQSHYVALAVELRSQARAVSARVQATHGAAEHYRSVLLPLAERIVDGTQRQVNAMQSGPFELLLAKQQQIDTAQRYLEALRDHWLARAALELLLAGRMVDIDTGPARPAAMAAGGSMRSAGGH